MLNLMFSNASFFFDLQCRTLVLFFFYGTLILLLNSNKMIVIIFPVPISLKHEKSAMLSLLLICLFVILIKIMNMAKFSIIVFFELLGMNRVKRRVIRYETLIFILKSLLCVSIQVIFFTASTVYHLHM